MDVSVNKSFYGLLPAEIEERVLALNVPKYRAAQLREWLYKKQILEPTEIKNLPKDFLQKLFAETPLVTLEFKEVMSAAKSNTKKYLFKTYDGHLLETVLISKTFSDENDDDIDAEESRDRQTVCVSTQLGCKVKCVFCASGKTPFLRHLSSGEIIEQVVRVKRLSGKKITNVVFMGMGEPLDNFDETVRAVKILTEDWGFGFSARRVTVSTSGITPKILEFVKVFEGRIRLSVSLHSTINETRSLLMPVNRKYPLPDLASALRRVAKDLKRTITFEWTLIPGVNDTEEEAEGLAILTKPLGAKVNVIPYNPIAEYPKTSPTKKECEKFCLLLEKRGTLVTLRQTEGRDISAACGQLRLDRVKKKDV